MSQPAAAPGGGAQGAAASADKAMKEYTLKAAGASAGQMFHVARFSQPAFDFGKLSQPTHMFRSQDIDKPPPEDGKGAHSAPLVVTSTEIVPKPVSRALATRDPEKYRHVPWLLEDSANEHNERPRQFHGGLDAGQSGKYGQELKVIPVTEWYHFKPRIQTRNAEALEKQHAMKIKLEERVRRVTKKLDEHAAEAEEKDDDDLKHEGGDDEERAARYSKEAKSDSKEVKNAQRAKREKIIAEDEADDKIDFEEVVSDDDEAFPDTVADEINEADVPKEEKKIAGSMSDEEKPLSKAGKEMDAILRKLQKDPDLDEEEEDLDESISGSESEERDEDIKPMDTSPTPKPAAAESKPEIMPTEVSEEPPAAVPKKEKKRKDEAEEERPGKKARPVEVKKEPAVAVKPEGRPTPSPMDITDNEFKQAFANAPGNKLTMKALVAKFKSRITAHPDQKTRFSLLVKRFTRAVKQGDETFVLLK